jgi:hypothetical protein
MPTASLHIGELLLREQLIDEEGLEQGLHAQGLCGGRLGTNLVELGLVSIADLGRVLAQQHAVPEATPQELLAADSRLLERITPAMCAKYRVLPLRMVGKVLHVAMIDPADLVQLDELAFAAGTKIQPHVTPELRMYHFLEQYCGVPRDERYRRLTDETLGAITSEINLSFAPEQDESTPDAEAPQRWTHDPPRAPRVPTGPMSPVKPVARGRRSSAEVPHLAPRSTRGSAESPRVGATTLAFERHPLSSREADDSQPTLQTPRQAASTTPRSARRPATGARQPAPRDLATGPVPPPDPGPAPVSTAPRTGTAMIDDGDHDQDLVYLDAVPRTPTSPSNVAVSAPLREEPSPHPTPEPPPRTPRPITAPAARLPSTAPRPAEAARQRAELPDLPAVPPAEDAAAAPPLVSLEAVFSGLDQAMEGSTVGRLLLLGASAQASLSVLFHLQGEMAIAQDAIGSPLAAEQVQQLTLPLGSSLLLHQAGALGEPVWGTVARDPLQQVVSGYLRAPRPDHVCVVPVSLGGRVAQLLCVQFPVGVPLTKEIYDDLIRLAEKGSATYARLAATRR